MTGDIYIFTADSYWDWLNFDFTNSPSKIHKFACEPIIFIDTKSSEDYIVAATEKNIFYTKIDLNEGFDDSFDDDTSVI